MEIPTQQVQNVEGVSQQQETPQSNILSEEEVNQILSGDGEGQPSPKEPTEEVTLPSETTDFVMPEKFAGKTAEDIAKAYIELEKMKGKQSAELTDGNETKPKESTEVSKEELSGYFKELSEKGELSEESYQALEKLGYTKEQVDEQIDFYQYKQAKVVSDILKPFGTKDDFSKAAEWARDNWTPEQVELFNNKLANADIETAQALLAPLFAGYNASKDKVEAPSTIHSNSTPSVSTKGYESRSDMLQDMNDPRYDSDPVYRSKVEAKMAETDLSKWYEGVPRGL